MSGKVKSKTVLSAITDKDVAGLFGEVLDNDSLDLTVAHKKSERLRTETERFVKVLRFFSQTKFMPTFTMEYGALLAFVDGLEKESKIVFDLPDISIYANKLTDKIDQKDVPKDEFKKFQEKYRLFKGCNLVNIIMVTLKNLMYHKNYIGDPDPANQNDKFITHSAGNMLKLVDKLDINFKLLYNNDQLGVNDKKTILMVLHKLYATSYQVYQVISSPDIDVDQFVNIVSTSIDDLKHRIPRCDDAFNRIKESVGMLKDNFGTYYKDYISSNNPAIIMENFIVDVSSKSKASAKLTRQFRAIIKHYKDLSKNGKQDPRLQNLFKHVDNNFTELERMNKEADRAKKEENKGEKSEEGDKTNKEKSEKKDDNEKSENKEKGEKKEKKPKTAAARQRLRNKKKRQNEKNREENREDNKEDNKEENREETVNISPNVTANQTETTSKKEDSKENVDKKE